MNSSFNKPLITVIVIAYNSAFFIEETLESVKEQSYENLEIIICDDNSKDDTVAIAEKWIIRNKARFVFVTIVAGERNLGIPGNCNRGYLVAKGKFIKLIAADDILKDNCIEDSIKKMQEEKADFLFASMDYINSKGEPLNKSISQYPEFFSKLNIEKKLKVYSRYPEFLNVPTWVVKKSLLDLFDGYDVSYFLLEDQVLLMKALALKAKVVYLSKTTVKYRIHEGSSVTSNNKKLIGELIRVRKELRWKHLNSSNPKDLLYKIDDLLHLKFATSKRKKILYVTRIINPAFFAKIFINKVKNAGICVFLKKAIS